MIDKTSDNIKKLSTSKEPTQELVSLFELAANHLSNFVQVWLMIKEKGLKEGFTEKELQDMFRPYLRKIGKNKDQIYYLFHRDEQIDRVNDNRKFTMEQLLSDKDEKIRSLQSQLDILRSPESRNQLLYLEEKQRHLEQDLLDWQKEYVEWSEKKADIIKKLANDFEIKYTILHKPLDTICIDIFEDLKSKHCIDGDAETVLYNNLPDKYKNLTKQEFKDMMLKALCSS
jgi:uncharacterized protein YbaR (Trm112 family)